MSVTYDSNYKTKITSIKTQEAFLSVCILYFLYICSPVYSPRISLDIMTVKMGAELFTVSANDTATFFRLTKPRTTVVNLTRAKWPHLMFGLYQIGSYHQLCAVCNRFWHSKAKYSLYMHTFTSVFLNLLFKDKSNHLMSPTNSMIMMKLGGYSNLDLCW